MEELRETLDRAESKLYRDIQRIEEANEELEDLIEVADELREKTDSIQVNELEDEEESEGFTSKQLVIETEEISEELEKLISSIIVSKVRIDWFEEEGYHEVRVWLELPQ